MLDWAVMSLIVGVPAADALGARRPTRPDARRRLTAALVRNGCDLTGAPFDPSGTAAARHPGTTRPTDARRPPPVPRTSLDARVTNRSRAREKRPPCGCRLYL